MKVIEGNHSFAYVLENLHRLSHIAGCPQPIYFIKGNEIIILSPSENETSKFWSFYRKNMRRVNNVINWQSIVEYLKYESH